MGISSEQWRRQNAEKMIQQRNPGLYGEELEKLLEAFDVFIRHFPIHRSVDLVEIARLRADSLRIHPAEVAEIMTTVHRMEGRYIDRTSNI